MLLRQSFRYSLQRSRTRLQQPVSSVPRSFGLRLLSKATPPLNGSGSTTKPVRSLAEQPRDAKTMEYPRLGRDDCALSCAAFRSRYGPLLPGEERQDTIVSVRDGESIQIVCSWSRIESEATDLDEFLDFRRMIQRGDIISVTGVPSRESNGELSVRAKFIPTLLSPSLNVLPLELTDRETRTSNRHLDLLVNPEVGETVRLRSHIIRYLRDFLHEANFVEVETPILTGGAGGATARPFRTTATEFPAKELDLRIAPEVWLKRLIIGGMDRIFEIGPAFRNEGLDKTHNPEFTSCEFYQAFANLEDLMDTTETMFRGLHSRVKELKETALMSLPALDVDFDAPFQRLDFISTVEEAIGQKLPNLAASEATEDLIGLFKQLVIPLPAGHTVPNLLDRLSATYIEPLCTGPTFIVNHPECLAPLAKSFVDPASGQRVSARVELFVNSIELANAYEEENSPLEQRRKLEDQVRLRQNDQDTPRVDESYLAAMEWGLPPTGGWGCGVDRLVMLFVGTNRIGDVLSFGSLRNVVALAPKA
ncbi:MAG: hypothetical protein M1825_000457 [Sarcosagium campestre]|nr:MAG: hypothetical protein M1825_000457 [Sarcosagium campestre]